MTHTPEEVAAIEAEHDHEIALLRLRLAKALADADADLTLAARTLTELRGDVYDESLAEGFAGDDMETLIRDAARDVRTAMAVLNDATGRAR